MITRDELTGYLHELLDVDGFQDGCPNGLQVEGTGEIRCLVSGVTANLPLIEAAVELGADALLVHHGYFWKGEEPVVVGMKQRRLKRLLVNDINLLAFHLPLDAHPVHGNNARLASLLEFLPEGTFGGSPAIGLWGRLPATMDVRRLSDWIAERLGRVPLVIPAGPSSIETVAWCSGAAQSCLVEAVQMGMDAFITGEVSEPAVHVAREYGIHLFAAGHHATERYGVMALGEHLAERFALQHHFIDIDSPL